MRTLLLVPLLLLPAPWLRAAEPVAAQAERPPARASADPFEHDPLLRAMQDEVRRRAAAGGLRRRAVFRRTRRG